MNSIGFRTVFGGPPTEAILPTKQVTRPLGELLLPYDLDILLYVGGDISTSDKPTGLHAPRVSVARRTMTAQIHVGRDELAAAADAREFLHEVIHSAVREMITRIAAKDPSVDAEVEIAKIDALEDSRVDG